MEYINNQALSSVEDPNIFLETVVEVVRRFEQVRCDKSGPFHGGLPMDSSGWMSQSHQQQYQMLRSTTTEGLLSFWSRDSS